MASTPYSRIAHITGLGLPSYARQAATTSPTTITGSLTAVYSYQLPIALKVDEAWLVWDTPNSPTTNRHLSALQAVLTANTYSPTDEITDRYERGPYRIWRATV